MKLYVRVFCGMRAIQEHDDIASVGIGHREGHLVLVPAGAIANPPGAQPITIEPAQWDRIVIEKAGA